MVLIRGNTIKLTKGDNACLYLDVCDMTGQKQEIDGTIVMTIAALSAPTTAVLTKTLSSDGYFIFNHSDTASMTTGYYRYDVQLTTTAGEVYTIIPPSSFELTTEVSA